MNAWGDSSEEILLNWEKKNKTDGRPESGVVCDWIQRPSFIAFVAWEAWERLQTL